MADNQKKLPNDEQVRLMLWAVPRSGSTAFAKFISFVTDSLIFDDTFFAAFWFGTDNVFKEHPNPEMEEKLEAFKKEAAEVGPTTTGGFDATKCSYKWIQEQLEKPHAGKKLIFNKDMSFSMDGKYEFIPKGYRHVFIVRNPLKALPSTKKMLQFFMGAPTLDDFKLYECPRQMFPAGYAYKESSDLFDHIRETHDKDAIVINTDDLLNNPRGILSALFENIGLPFEEKLLSWEAGFEVTKRWVASEVLLQGNTSGEYYKTAFASTCFTKPNPFPERSSLTPDVLHCVDGAMQWYEKLYANRLKAK